HALNELRRLARAAHVLDELRERVEVGADDAEDELVVVAIEAVALEPDVERFPRLAVAAADRRVLGHDPPLLLLRQAVESADAPERVPDGPAVRRRERVASRVVQQPVLEIALAAEGVRAPRHRKGGNGGEAGERRPREEAARGASEDLGFLRHHEDADAPWI